MSLAALIRAMTDAGATPEAIALAVEAVEARDQIERDRKASRAAARKRQRADRNAKVAAMSQPCRATVAVNDGDSDATNLPLVSPKDNISNPHPTPSSSSLRSDELLIEFETIFWKRYPKSAGRKAALKAWPKARKAASLEEIMEGLEIYIASKEPWREWMDAATFLNGERWKDRPSSGPASGTASEAAASLVPVDRDSPEGEAWDAFLREKRGKGAPWANGRWHFPSRWPPGREPQHRFNEAAE